MSTPHELWTENTWLTTTLRPAGLVDDVVVDRLAESIATLSTTCDIIVLDLSACAIAELELLAEALRVPARRLARNGGCLMLRGASDELLRMLEHAPLVSA